MRLAIWPHVSFQVRSGYKNSEPLTCAPRGGEASERGVRACLSRPVRGDFDTFCAFSEGWQLGNRGFGDVVFHCFTAFYVNF